ncbi:macro domain-containing protein [Euzebya sp.]|uniref:type II toxin-antitoxin system antitoxin DNA ADP-ribosyl glycohydrolase DarG n=1 Tax=Euzebya sp. TaxID=1971409 RepID=UPI0035118D16
MIIDAHGNLLEAEVDALVNTVNTVGVMGKGIALQFKKAFPDMFAEYKRASDRGELRLGHVHVYETGRIRPRFIINFPTKRHWRAKSRLEDIRAGLVDLSERVQALGITSIAVPPLGCGHGGLNWADVRPLIVEALEGIPGVDVLLYAPEGAPPAAELVNRTERPRMTMGRAALVALIARYADKVADVSLIDVQKLMYFLQEAGQPLRLNYVKDRYGPYADNLRHVLHTVEGHFLIGYGDATATVHAAEPIRVLPGAIDEADAVLSEQPRLGDRIDRVLRLVDGFESPYAMELLATVHWVTTKEDPDTATDPGLAAERVAEWNSRKERMFGADHVRAAWTRLQDEGWLPVLTSA